MSEPSSDTGASVRGVLLAYLRQPDGYYHAEEFKQTPPTHVAHSLSADACRERREAVCAAVNELVDDEEAVEIAFVVERVLGLGGDS